MALAVCRQIGMLAAAFILLALLLARDARAQQANGGSPFPSPAFNAYDQSLGNERALAVGDVNGDGKPDLVFAGARGFYCYNAVGVLFGSGDGTFRAPTCYDPGSTDVLALALADMNGDGQLDLVAAGPCDSANNCATGNLGILLGNRDGTFQPVISNTSGIQGAGLTTISIGDVNRDGRMDAVAFNGASNNVLVLLGNGDGTLQSAIGYNPPYAQPGPSSLAGALLASTVLADLNGDGAQDIVMLSSCVASNDCSSGALGFLLGNGDGTFQSSSSSQLLTQNAFRTQALGATAMVVSDLNGDGVLDVAVASSGPTNADGVISVFMGVGGAVYPNPIFSPAVTADSGGVAASSVSSVDMNGDGKLDLIVFNDACTGCSTSSSLAVLLGNGDGTFQAPLVNTSGLYGGGPMIVTDLNGDHVPDAIVNANQVFVLLGGAQKASAAPVPLWGIVALGAGLMGVGARTSRKMS